MGGVCSSGAAEARQRAGQPRKARCLNRRPGMLSSGGNPRVATMGGWQALPRACGGKTCVVRVVAGLVGLLAPEAAATVGGVRVWGCGCVECIERANVRRALQIWCAV